MRSILILLAFVGFIPIHAQIDHADSLGTFNKSTDEEIIYTNVTVMPKFPGGDNALYDFLRKNIIYPVMAKEMGIQGKVYASFNVEKDGTITDIKIDKGIGDECDKEVIRVLKLMPKWDPGINKEETVRVRYKLPVNFAIK